MKGKVEKKGAASKSLSSKSSSKNMSESFKSKEFVSSDESSSGDNKKEVGRLGGWLGWVTQPLFPGDAPSISPKGGSLIPAPQGLAPSESTSCLRYAGHIPQGVGDLSLCYSCPQVTAVTLSPLWGTRVAGSGSCCPDPVPPPP